MAAYEDVLEPAAPRPTRRGGSSPPTASGSATWPSLPPWPRPSAPIVRSGSKPCGPGRAEPPGPARPARPRRRAALDRLPGAARRPAPGISSRSEGVRPRAAAPAAAGGGGEAAPRPHRAPGAGRARPSPPPAARRPMQGHRRRAPEEDHRLPGSGPAGDPGQADARLGERTAQTRARCTVDEAHFGHEHPGGPGLGLRRTAQTPDGARRALRGRPALSAAGHGRRHREGVPAGRSSQPASGAPSPLSRSSTSGVRRSIRPAVAQHHLSRPSRTERPAPFQELTSPSGRRAGRRASRTARASTGRPPEAQDEAGVRRARCSASRPRRSARAPPPAPPPRAGRAAPARRSSGELDLRGVRKRLQDAEVVVGDHVLEGRVPGR